ncbi:unnamed protein product [Caenorhabditis angaria]|uniref:Uncharacterized protein n=1 Tax=Caenorhabditis angaria TaxID=860376 RepID=A0A9P1IY67_9PELO|nr:unnamed protein product [Caenorhabditis angaria]
MMTLKFSFLLLVFSTSLASALTSYSSSSSSESDSYEDYVQKPLVRHQKRIDPPKPKVTNEKTQINSFFDRPTQEELNTYDSQVKNDKLKQVELFDRPESDEINAYDKIVKSSQIAPAEEKQENIDDADEKLMLETLGRLYLAEGSRGSASYEDEDNSLYLVPLSDYQETPKVQSNNNNNKNVLVKVNNFNVKTNVVGDIKKPEDKPKDQPLPPPVPHSDSRFVYLHLNLIDFLTVSFILAFLFTIIRKSYKKCFAAQVPPPLPTTAIPPPHYLPNSVVVETTKKVPV